MGQRYLQHILQHCEEVNMLPGGKHSMVSGGGYHTKAISCMSRCYLMQYSVDTHETRTGKSGQKRYFLIKYFSKNSLIWWRQNFQNCFNTIFIIWNELQASRVLLYPQFYSSEIPVLCEIFFLWQMIILSVGYLTSSCFGSNFLIFRDVSLCGRIEMLYNGASWNTCYILYDVICILVCLQHVMDNFHVSPTHTTSSKQSHDTHTGIYSLKDHRKRCLDLKGL